MRWSRAHPILDNAFLGPLLFLALGYLTHAPVWWRAIAGVALKAGIATTGQHLTGTVTFDVPPGDGRVQLKSGLAGSGCDRLVGT